MLDGVARRGSRGRADDGQLRGGGDVGESDASRGAVDQSLIRQTTGRATRAHRLRLARTVACMYTLYNISSTRANTGASCSRPAITHERVIHGCSSRWHCLVRAHVVEVFHARVRVNSRNPLRMVHLLPLLLLLLLLLLFVVHVLAGVHGHGVV